ncbi:MAG: 50S ribosomal protein L25 [Microgenomates bacterium OLB22]|nr:MAG: 50S ribosomal protein L25 [Microgenomates bacterium OLB22]
MSSDTIHLPTQARSIFGKQVRQLRAKGRIPANIYGNGEPSQAISVDLKDATHVFRDAGMTQVVHLMLDKKDTPSVIADIHQDPLTGTIAHLDFKRINLNKKMEAHVPLEIVGESEGVKLHNAELNLLHQEVLIEAFPADIPTHIEVDVTSLVELSDEITIGDLVLDSKIKLLDDPGIVLVKLHEHVEHSTEPDVTADEPAPVEAQENPEEAASSEE